jgi:hypothetical protein
LSAVDLAALETARDDLQIVLFRRHGAL